MPVKTDIMKTRMENVKNVMLNVIPAVEVQIIAKNVLSVFIE